jgi:hypothetical protein
MAAERNLDPGIKPVLEELRDLRVEMRADRKRADEDRQRADEDRQRADEERRRADEASARREAAMLKVFKDIRTVGFAIVKTLNHHTRILERIDRRLAGPGNDGRRGRGNGR